MEIVGWTLVIALFIIGMVGTVYPVLPSVVAIYFAFFVYGWFFSFAEFNVWFWIIETLIVVVLLAADYLVGAYGTRKFGGSRLAVILSVIGLIVGPFVIPAFGLILGPLIGAVAAELIQGRDVNSALRVGWGTVLGLFASAVVKIILQLAMIGIWVIWIVIY
ncbi:DUF456 domain-containing protein [Paenibacillus campi]|uniref:DUF456 domain-containing protein n=1 Tax=Paenibacillus campi TaxID=3106031 RepID=UPI002AFF11B8|nr:MULTISPECIES: DUF456 family protein [unclassified Paenibacillus]